MHLICDVKIIAKTKLYHTKNMMYSVFLRISGC